MFNNLFEKKILDPKTDPEKVTGAEMVFGHLIGPALSFLMINALSGNYLLQYYTDVLGVSGSLIVAMPLLSKILVSAANLFFCRQMELRKGRQGKARPWILLSGILLTVTGLLLYAVPRASGSVQILWVIVSYNLFFVLANNIYTLAHHTILPATTRDGQVRDKLSLLKNVSEAMIPGTLSAVIMPLLITRIGVGEPARANWFRFMSLLSCLALPACVLEYFFTMERVTAEGEMEVRELRKQFGDCLRDRSWLIVMLLFAIKTVEGLAMQSTLVYYCNWVLSSSVGKGARMQVIMNVLGQFPMGPGLLVLWPLVRKYGKNRVMRAGYLISALGCAAMLLGGSSFYPVIAGMFVKSCGSIVSYLSMSLLSDIIDGFEEKYGYRADTLSMSAVMILSTVGSGLVQSVLLLGIRAFGYVAPSDAFEVIAQPQQIRTFFTAMFCLIPLIGFLISYALVRKLDKNMTKKQKN